MSARYFRSRTDGPHKDIGRTLRKVTVCLDVHGFGPIGCDFLAKHLITKQPMFLEVKDPSKPPSARQLTSNETFMSLAFEANYRVVMTADEALAAVGAK